MTATTSPRWITLASLAVIMAVSPLYGGPLRLERRCSHRRYLHSNPEAARGHPKRPPAWDGDLP